MSDEEDLNEKSYFNVKFASLQSLQLSDSVRSLRIMHSPDLCSMQGVNLFKQLKVLNLSQNSITKAEVSLQNLESLSLQGNRIKEFNIDCPRLRSLNLSHNVISNLKSLFHLNITMLDIRANCIADINELRHLPRSVKELFIDTEKRKNPICKDQGYLKALFKINPELIVDDQKITNNNAVDDHPKPKPQNNIPVNMQIEQEAERMVHVLQLQQQIQDLKSQQRELIFKFECNEKYWTQKVSTLEMEIVESQQNNQKANDENKRLKKQIDMLKENMNQYVQDNQQLTVKKDRKDELINELQTKVSELLQQNGSLSKESQITNEECRSLKIQINEREAKLSEVKAQLRESEKSLQDFHKASVDQSSAILLRQEQVQSRYEAIIGENKSITAESNALKRRMQEMLEICREWEVKFESQVAESTLELQLKQAEEQRKHEAHINQISRDYEMQIMTIERDSREAQDHLEQEVRGVLRENLDKLKNYKTQLDEKTLSEHEYIQNLRILNQRVKELESANHELQSNVQKLKKDYTDVMLDRDNLSRESRQQKENQQKEISQHQEVIQEIKSRYNLQDQLLKTIKEESIQINHENQVIKMKYKQYQHLEAQVEELQTTITIKNKMLDDKNDSIEELKNQLAQVKNNDGSQTEEYNRLQRKYERQSQIIEECETQINSLQEEFEAKGRELKEKKQLIHLFEREIEEIRDKQDQEVAHLKEELQQKESQSIEMIQLLEDAKEGIKRKDEQLRQLTQTYNSVNKQLQQIDHQTDQRINEKEQQVQQLKRAVLQLQDQIELLKEENERVKRSARDNLNNLHKLLQ